MRKVYLKGHLLIGFIVFSCLLSPMKLSATHSIGAELTYECTGPNQYLFTYNFYRDCAGVPASPNITVNGSSSCFPGVSFVLNPTVWSPLPYTSTCPTALTTCNGGVYDGIELWVFTGVTTLPGACTDWRFTVSICCRNSVITTADTASTTNLFTYCLLNNQDAPCNNSAYFTDDPYPFGCVGQKLCFNNEAYDSDGDSLSYQLIDPMASSTLALNYNPPYSGMQPVLSSPPAHINSVSGEFCMYPTQADISVFAVLVSEYRNGILIGQVERDLQFKVNNCSNTAPTLSGLQGTANFNATLCAGSSYEFSIYSSDPDVGQNTNIQWNWGIPSGSFVSFGTARDSAHFLWTPGMADVNTNPHCFLANVSDDNCPYYAYGTGYYCFTVIDSSNILCGNVSVTEESIPVSVRVYSSAELNQYRLEWNKSLSFSNLQIFDTAGRLVIQENLNSQTAKTISLENLSRGVYFVCLEGNDFWSKCLIR